MSFAKLGRTKPRPSCNRRSRILAIAINNDSNDKIHTAQDCCELGNGIGMQVRTKRGEIQDAKTRGVALVCWQRAVGLGRATDHHCRSKPRLLGRPLSYGRIGGMDRGAAVVSSLLANRTLVATPPPS